MIKELEQANEKFISVMEQQDGVLGGWYFGSRSHELSDDYSDIDIVFLLDGAHFELLASRLPRLLKTVCDKVILCWEEDFNSERIKSYACILKLNSAVFQYDIFLLNQRYIEDELCRVHYTSLQEKDIIFDTDGMVAELIAGAPAGVFWTADITRLITTYWLHVQMSTKYFLRKDFFKLEAILRILMDTHTSVLLAHYDIIPWGGSASKLHFIDDEKQQHLMRYGCTGDFAQMRENLLQSIQWFEEDIRDSATKKDVTYSERIGAVVKDYWKKKTKKM